MSTASPIDLRLVLHDDLSEGYELSKVLLARADLDGTLQLLTSAWERLLGYGRKELNGKTLLHLMWSSERSAAAAAAALLDEMDMRPVRLRLRCRNGRGRSLTLHRLYDRNEHTMYIVAEETPAERPDARAGVICAREERRAAARAPG